MKSYLIPWFILLPTISFSQLQLAGIFSDNMVLQRDKPINIWGKAAPGNTITITFSNETVNTTADKDSSWFVRFPRKNADGKPLILKVSTKEENIVLQNMIMGDVWLCIGQSNMEWPMQREMHYAEERSNSDRPMLRFFNPSYAGKNIYASPFTDSVIQRLDPQHFYNGHWQPCDSLSMKDMSAVAYYFGKSIAAETGVPIGLINLSIGGAPLETFIDPGALSEHEQFASKVKGDWLQNPTLPVWVRERGRQNVGDHVNVPGDAQGKHHAYKPGFAYKAGIEPLLRMPIKGILNYQGESNAQEADRVNEYAALTALMVDGYRKKWELPYLPYYFVQLSSIDTAKYKGHLWPKFRDEQRKTLSLIPHSGMAVSSDVGAKDDVHPTNKKDVGERLARWALYGTYGRNIVPSGPLPLQAKYKKDKVIVTFRYAATALMTADDRPVRGFSFDGSTEVEGRLDKKRVILETRDRPGLLYYGWKPFSDANLINSEKLPASTFRIKVK